MAPEATHNLKVAGSNPAPVTKISKTTQIIQQLELMTVRDLGSPEQNQYFGFEVQLALNHATKPLPAYFDGVSRLNVSQVESDHESALLPGLWKRPGHSGLSDR